MKQKKGPSAETGQLAPERAFVVQLRAGESVQLAGRVENVATGQHQLFDSGEELNEFIRRTAGPHENG